MKFIRRAMIATATAGAALGLFAAGAVGSPEAVGSPRMTAAADEAPGPAVEDFAYPDAAKILAEQGIVLKRGDGHILLATCGGEAGLIEVWARGRDKVCFKVTGAGGYLSLDIPAVFAIKGNDYTTTVDMTVGTEQKSFAITQNAWTAVGESADPEARDHALVEITAKR
ncbi:hypothetical protein ACFC0K_25710 [Streptomyces hydrogenans]|uniref:hypothetical protein n=1 Tax=Streptomyces hydrogenans TaxID=1873719 RepID=UPI0035E1D688